MLVAAVVGLETRATMDIDTTVKSLPLTMENARKVVEDIIQIDVPDGMSFAITKVSDIMIRDVKTTTQDVFLEEAAQLMIDNEIGVLPVVDADGRVIGIITDKDVFQAFNDLMGYGQRGTRFVINCENVPGYFVGIAKLFAENDANLDSLAVYHSEERGAEVVIKATGEVEVERMMQVLLDGGYNLTDVVQTTADGEMKRYPIHK